MEKRIIHIGADSAGYELKESLMAHLRELGYECHDHGTYSKESCHYPIFAEAVCREVQKAPDKTFGLLVCGTGIGMSMCANKFKGIRAALCSDTFSAGMTRMHNDANVICMGARVIGPALAQDILDAFLSAEFEDGGRHRLRVDMMTEIENKQK